MATKTAKERMNETLLEMATALYDVNEIDAVTMRQYKDLCIPKTESLKAKEIKQIRIKEGVSQPIFAKLLNISPETIKKWEQGDRHPTGASLKLLRLVEDQGIGILTYSGKTKSSSILRHSASKNSVERDSKRQSNKVSKNSAPRSSMRRSKTVKRKR